jgi:hypothetical protein
VTSTGRGAYFAADVHAERDVIGGDKIVYYYPPIQRAALRDSFKALVDDRVALFGGRKAAMDQILAFLGRPERSRLMVTAPAGFGKTALLANLVASKPEAFAYHFFAPSGFGFDESTTEVFFLRNVVEQMGEWYGNRDLTPERKDALLPLFNRYLGAAPATRVLVLDGLDEVTGWDLKTYIGRPMPDGLKLILSVRDVGQDWIAEYGLRRSETEHLPLGGLTRDELASFLRSAGKVAAVIANDADLLNRAAAVSAFPDNPALGADPFYARILAEDAADATLTPDNNKVVLDTRDGLQQRLSLAEYVDRHPQGLANYLDGWYEEVKEAAGEAATLDLLATLTVTLGPIGLDDLTRLHPSLARRFPSSPLTNALDRARRLVERSGPKRDRVAFTHPRLKQHVQTRIDEQDPTLLDQYTRMLLADCAQWRQHRGTYALRYYAQHLQDRAAETSGSQRTADLQQIAQLIVDPEFLALRKELVGDLAGLQADFERVLSKLCGEQTVGVEFIVDVALTWLAFRRERLQPEHVIDLAKAGDLDDAKRQLRLFVPPLDASWYRAAQLMVAWLGSTVNPQAARSLCREVWADLELLPSEEHRLRVERLRRWVAVALGDEQPLAPAVFAPPDSQLVAALVERLSGVGVHQSLTAPPTSYGELADPVEGRYMAASDGPHLLALSFADRRTGDLFFGQYLAIHRAYRYVQYRNGSLWALLESVLKYPDPVWVQEKVVDICRIAMAESGVEFQEGLGLTALALQAALGDPAATEKLAASTARARDDMGMLSAERGHADTWGRHKRRLGALAEASSRSQQQAHNSQPQLRGALGTPFGFAGYQAPACLTLAESVMIATPEDTPAVQRALADALAAAHNVQDGTLCARTTARVLAMTRWSAQPLAGAQLLATVERLARDPSSSEFCSEHRVGERYPLRSPTQNVPLPADLRSARTLEALAYLFDLPLPEFRRANAERGWLPDQSLDDGEIVRVPDPSFPALLAARLSAQVVVDDSFDAAQRSRSIRSLVPIALSNPTALDTVLSRLLLAVQCDAAVLRQVEQLANTKMAPPEDDFVRTGLPG